MSSDGTLVSPDASQPLSENGNNGNGGTTSVKRTSIGTSDSADSGNININIPSDNIYLTGQLSSSSLAAISGFSANERPSMK